mmetsp:Transcript_970/g.1368  ORF Transcript_970/g.1368 Transcript_970/m.1368 type:complete len:207 (+) Transcript_970:961-1581(+)
MIIGLVMDLVMRLVMYRVVILIFLTVYQLIILIVYHIKKKKTIIKKNHLLHQNIINKHAKLQYSHELHKVLLQKLNMTNLQRFKKILIIKNVLLHVQGHGLEIPVVIRNVMLHLVFGMLVTVDPFKLMLQQIQQYLIFLSVSMVLLLILRDCLILILLMPTFKKKVLTQKLLSMISYFSDKLKSLLFILMLPKQNKFLHHGKGLNK